jgi:hypothetical protein
MIKHNFRSSARLLIFAIAAVLLSSCFHKNVLTDRADNIDATVVYQGKEGSYIICREVVFQATNKSSGRGITKISGYNQFRISSYDLNTGKLSARVNLKEGMDEGECILLGVTEGKIWFYSLNKDLGLHCRDPKTLDVIANQEKLCANPQLKALSFAKPKWYDLHRYFSFNWMNNKIMLSDQQGYTYYYNPANDSVTRTSDKIDVAFIKDFVTTAGDRGNNKYVYMSNDNRSKIQINNKDVSGNDLSFLSGKLILDLYEANVADARNKYEVQLRATMKNLQDSIAHFAAVKHAATDAEYKMQWNYEAQQRRVNEIENYFKYPLPDKRALLTDEPNSLLVYQASDVTDTARLIISKVKLEGDTAAAEEWKCTLHNFYFDADKANHKGAFETVFSKGDPQFRYQWFDIVEGKLIIIAQLQMACIDMKTGKVLWNINI